MATVDLVMPKMGESIMEATILKWHKKQGDTVKMDETVLEIATDKVDSEVPSTAEGVIEELLYAVNDVVPVGAVIAKVKTGSSETTFPIAPEPLKPAAATTVSEPKTEVSSSAATSESMAQNGTSGVGKFYSPLVLNIAAQEGVSLTELEKITGTGNDGRVTKRDILQYVSDKRNGKLANEASAPQPTIQQAPQASAERDEQRMPANTNNKPATYSGNVEIIEMDRMRRLIADHMVRSKHTSPHVTSFSEADVTNLVQWRNKNKNDFEKREGTKITFTPLFMEA